MVIDFGRAKNHSGNDSPSRLRVLRAEDVCDTTSKTTQHNTDITNGTLLLVQQPVCTSVLKFKKPRGVFSWWPKKEKKNEGVSHLLCYLGHCVCRSQVIFWRLLYLLCLEFLTQFLVVVNIWFPTLMFDMIQNYQQGILWCQNRRRNSWKNRDGSFRRGCPKNSRKFPCAVRTLNAPNYMHSIISCTPTCDACRLYTVSHLAPLSNI